MSKYDRQRIIRQHYQRELRIARTKDAMPWQETALSEVYVPPLNVQLVASPPIASLETMTMQTPISCGVSEKPIQPATFYTMPAKPDMESMQQNPYTASRKDAIRIIDFYEGSRTSMTRKESRRFLKKMRKMHDRVVDIHYSDGTIEQNKVDIFYGKPDVDHKRQRLRLPKGGKSVRFMHTKLSENLEECMQ
jgi:hypothetical protein